MAPTSIRTETYGRGEHCIDERELCYTPDAVVRHLRETFRSDAYTPPVLPAIALQLMAITREPDVSLAQVRELLEQDSLLAAKLVRVAQSALYNRGSAIASIDDAITRIGLHNAGDVFLQTALSARVFRAKGYDAPMEAIRRHSIATAHLARLTCRLTSLPDEYAFMCGLLHDVGMAAGLLILAADQRHPPPFATIASAVQAVHEEASAILANAWQLPPDVELVLRHHHQFMVGNRPHPLAAAVCVADWLASEAGAALGGEVRDQSAGNAARCLGLSNRDLESLSAQARDVVAAL